MWPAGWARCLPDEKEPILNFYPSSVVYLRIKGVSQSTLFI